MLVGCVEIIGVEAVLGSGDQLDQGGGVTVTSGPGSAQVQMARQEAATL